MSDLRRERIGLALTVVLASLVVAFHFHAILRAPGHYMYNTDGDGLKNYYSFAWHVRHDTGAFVFSGMNAPFGEHINYPDAQPLISNAWRTTCKLVPALEPHTVALMNLLMLGSWVVAAAFLFLVLRMWGVGRAFAVAVAVITPFLSMQVLRTTQAHYALSYACCLPMTIWAGMRMLHSARPWRTALFLGILLFAWLAIHVYLGFMAAALICLWALFAFGRPARIRAAMFLAPLLALAIFQGLVVVTDTHTGRTDHPEGYFDYQTTWATLFSSDHEWGSPLAHALMGTCSGHDPETWSYLGLGILLCTSLLLLTSLVALPRLKATAPLREQLASSFNNGFAGLLGAALLLALFAFGLPFDLGLEKWHWYTPVIRQFRAPSRFAWPLYVVLALWNARALWSLFHRSTAPITRWAWGLVMGLSLALPAYEGFYLDRHVAGHITSNPNYFDRTQLPDDLRQCVDIAGHVHARAILDLPWFHNGAEELMIPCDGPGLLAGQVLAYHTGLPLMASSLTRTSLHEVRDLIRACGPPWYERPALPGWQGTDTLLVLRSSSPLGTYDQDILSRCHPLGHAGDLSLYTITVGQLLRDERNERLAWFATHRDSLYHSGDWYFSRPDTFLLDETFETTPARHTHRGHGAFAGLKRDFNKLLTFQPGMLDTGVTYLASFWYYDQGPMRCHALAGADDYDPATNTGRWDYYTDPRFCRTIDGDWSLVELPFRASSKGARVQLFVQGKPYYPDSIWVDDLLVRKAEVDVYRVLEGPSEAPRSLLFNGHLIRRDDDHPQ